MVKSIDFLFDISSPNAYLAHKAIPGIEQRTGAKFAYKICLLGGIFNATGNQTPALTFANVKGKIAYELLEIERFRKAHGIDRFKFNSAFPVNSLMMMRAALIVEAKGDLPHFIDTCFNAVWEQDENMADKDVFVRVLTQAGFDGEALLAGTQDPEIKAKLAKNTEEAVNRGAFGMPTFFVGDEMFFGKERLGQVEAAITAMA